MATPAPEISPAPQSRQIARPRSPLLEKYRRVEKPREPTPDDEIRVMGNGRVSKYVTYASRLFNEQGKRALTIRATGKAVSIAVSVCEVIKRRFKGIHQVVTIGWTEVVDEYEPLEEGLEPRTEKRNIPSISVFLTFDEDTVDKKAVGYQAPLDESLVSQQGSVELLSRPRPRRNQQRRMSGAPKAEGQHEHEGAHENENRPARGGGGARRGPRGGRRRNFYPREGGEQQHQQHQAPIAERVAGQAPVAQAPVAQATVAQATVAQATVAQAPVAQAPVAKTVQ